MRKSRAKRDLRHANHVACLSVLLLNPLACSTTGALISASSEPATTPIVYGGVRTLWDEPPAENVCLESLSALDLWASFALDTALLPITLSWAWNVTRASWAEERPADELSTEPEAPEPPAQVETETPRVTGP